MFSEVDDAILVDDEIGLLCEVSPFRRVGEEEGPKGVRYRCFELMSEPLSVECVERLKIIYEPRDRSTGVRSSGLGYLMQNITNTVRADLDRYVFLSKAERDYLNGGGYPGKHAALTVFWERGVTKDQSVIAVDLDAGTLSSMTTRFTNDSDCDQNKVRLTRRMFRLAQSVTKRFCES